MGQENRQGRQSQGRAEEGCPGRKKAAKPARKSTVPRAESKGAKILEMIGRAKGATLAEIMKATEWQAHSVRGFISTSGKKHNIKIESSNNEAGPRVRFDRIPAEQPNRPEVSLATAGGLYKAACEEPLRGFERTKAQRGTVCCIDGDLVALRRHLDSWIEGKEFIESPVSQERYSLHILDIRNRIQSSTVK